jgi:hypothetical protein
MVHRGHFVVCPVSGDTFFFEGDLEQSRADLLEEISARHGVTILEVIKVVMKAASDELDPLAVEDRVGTYEFDRVRLGPPSPAADCDLGDAWRYAKDAAKLNEEELQNGEKLTLREALYIFRDTISWIRFWSRRHPHEDWRKKFAEELKAAEANAQEIIAKAKTKGITIGAISDG